MIHRKIVVNHRKPKENGDLTTINGGCMVIQRDFEGSEIAKLWKVTSYEYMA